MVTFDAGTFTMFGGNVVVVTAGLMLVVVVGSVVVGGSAVVVVSRSVVVVTRSVVVTGGWVVAGFVAAVLAEAAFEALVHPASTASATGAATNRQPDRTERWEVFTEAAVQGGKAPIDGTVIAMQPTVRLLKTPERRASGR
jgi:hypothetical protein